MSATTEQLYVFNALWFRKDGGAARYREYLEEIAPLLAEHGGRPIAGYRPTGQLEGSFDPDLFGAVEWSGDAAFRGFLNDPHYREVAHLRDQAIERAVLLPCGALPGLIPEPEVPPGEEAVFIFNALWFRPDGGRDGYLAYVAAIDPILRRHGGLPVEAYLPGEPLEGEFRPDLIGVVRWPTRGAFDSFLADPEYAAHASLRANSLVRALLTAAERVL